MLGQRADRGHQDRVGALHLRRPGLQSDRDHFGVAIRKEPRPPARTGDRGALRCRGSLAPVGAASPTGRCRREGGGIGPRESDQRLTPHAEGTVGGRDPRESPGGLGAAERAGGRRRLHLNIGERVVEQRHDFGGERGILEAGQRAKGVDLHLRVGVGGGSGQQLRHRLGGEARGIRVAASERAGRHRTDDPLRIAQRDAETISCRGSPKPAQGVGRPPTQPDRRVLQEREEGHHRRVATQAPRLQHHLAHQGAPVLHRRHDAAGEDALEEGADLTPADLRQRGDRLHRRGPVERGRAGDTVHEGAGAGRVPQEAQRKGCCHAHGRIGVGQERQHQRRGAPIADTSGPEHGETPHHGVGRDHGAGDDRLLEVPRVFRGEDRGDLLYHGLLLGSHRRR